MKKALFVNLDPGNIKLFPMKLASLISNTKKYTGYKPILFDETYHFRYEKMSLRWCLGVFKNFIIKEKPDYAAFEVFLGELEQFVKYARIIKEEAPSCRIILFGIYATSVGGKLLEGLKDIDILILGEGELVLSQILNKEKLDKIPNIVFRRSGEIIKTKRVPNYNFGIDEIEKPDRDSFNMKFHSRSVSLVYKRIPTVTMTLSLGCTGGCSFCVEGQSKGVYKARAPKKVIKEIEGIISKYPFIKCVYFTDSCFILSHPKVREFLDLFNKKGLNKRLGLGIMTKLKYINEKNLKLLKESNCVFVGMGLESFSQNIQKAIGKTFSIEEFKRKNKMIENAGIPAAYSIIFNYPGMSYEDVLYNIKQIEDNQLKIVNINNLVPMPSTKLFAELVKKGVLYGLNSKHIDLQKNVMQQYAKVSLWKLNKRQERFARRYVTRKKRQVTRYMFSQLSFKDKIQHIYMKRPYDTLRAIRQMVI